MKVPTYEEAKAWAEQQALRLQKSPRDKQAQYCLVLLHHIKSLERERKPDDTGRVIDIS